MKRLVQAERERKKWNTCQRTVNTADELLTELRDRTVSVYSTRSLAISYDEPWLLSYKCFIIVRFLHSFKTIHA